MSNEILEKVQKANQKSLECARLKGIPIDLVMINKQDREPCRVVVKSVELIASPTK